MFFSLENLDNAKSVFSFISDSITGAAKAHKEIKQHKMDLVESSVDLTARVIIKTADMLLQVTKKIDDYWDQRNEKILERNWKSRPESDLTSLRRKLEQKQFMETKVAEELEFYASNDSIN